MLERRARWVSEIVREQPSPPRRMSLRGYARTFETMLDHPEDDNRFQDIMNTLMFYGSDSVPETKAQIAADVARLERRWRELPPGSKALPPKEDDQRVLTMLRASPITGLAGAAIVAL